MSIASSTVYIDKYQIFCFLNDILAIVVMSMVSMHKTTDGWDKVKGVRGGQLGYTTD